MEAPSDVERAGSPVVVASDELSWDELTALVDKVVALIRERERENGWLPSMIIALSRGGFVPATLIASRLGVRNLVGVDVQKDALGIRSIGRYVKLDRVDEHRVLIVDDGIVTGNLLPTTADEVASKGGDPRTCALVSEGRCAEPDYLGEIRQHMPHFPWE